MWTIPIRQRAKLRIVELITPHLCADCMIEDSSKEFLYPSRLKRATSKLKKQETSTPVAAYQRNVRASADFQHTQRIGQGQLQRNIARHSGNGSWARLPNMPATMTVLQPDTNCSRFRLLLVSSSFGCLAVAASQPRNAVPMRPAVVLHVLVQIVFLTRAMERGF